MQTHLNHGDTHRDSESGRFIRIEGIGQAKSNVLPVRNVLPIRIVFETRSEVLPILVVFEIKITVLPKNYVFETKLQMLPTIKVFATTMLEVLPINKYV